MNKPTQHKFAARIGAQLPYGMGNPQRFNLILVLLATVLAVIGALSSGNAVVRAIFTTPLVLFLPGYTLSRVLFGWDRLGGVERTVFSVGLSMAITVLGGLLLNILPWGIQATSWQVLLGGVTVICCGVALLRPISGPAVTGSAVGGMPFGQIVLLAAAIIIVVAAGSIARNSAVEQYGSGTTQLWMLPHSAAGTGQIRIGLENKEADSLEYRLLVTADQRVLQEWSLIPLAAGAGWETTLTLPADVQGSARVQARLYRTDDPDIVYREVSLVGTTSQ